MDSEDVIQKKLEYWKGKLIDLSRKNNLISYKFVKSRTIKIAHPDVPSVINDLYNETKISFAKQDEKISEEQIWRSEGSDNVIDKKLFSLYRKTKQNFQESGISSCFVKFIYFEIQGEKK